MCVCMYVLLDFGLKLKMEVLQNSDVRLLFRASYLITSLFSNAILLCIVQP